jgi:tetratricopeptide (TPR) repeat protein
LKLQGDFVRAASLYDECLGIFRGIGDGSGVAWSLNYKGDVANEQGDPEGAQSLYEQSLAAFRQLNDDWGVASCLLDMGNLSGGQGNYEEAQRLYGESLRRFQQLGHKRGIARVLESVAASAAAQGNAESSLRMAGAAAALRKAVGAPLTPAEQAKLEKSLDTARRSLSNNADLAVWMEGWAMPVDQAVQEALSDGGWPPIRNRNSA